MEKLYSLLRPESAGFSWSGTFRKVSWPFSLMVKSPASAPVRLHRVMTADVSSGSLPV